MENYESLLPEYNEKSIKTIVVAGASGYIGKNIVQELLRLGDYKIKLLSRSLDKSSTEASLSKCVEIFRGDLREPESLKGLLEPNCIVINLVYLWESGEKVNLELIENLLKACKVAGVKRLIHCSTAAVVGRVKDNLITEETKCSPVSSYGITKLNVEQTIITGGRDFFDIVILRPTSVFGPSGNPLKKLASDIASGNRFKNYLKSSLFGKRRMNLVSVSNVIGAIIFMIERNENLGGEIFIVSDDDCITNNYEDVERRLLEKLNIKDYLLPRVPLPSILLKILLSILGRNNINPNCNYSSNKLRNLGYNFPVNFENALDEYAVWYRSTIKDRY